MLFCILMLDVKRLAMAVLLLTPQAPIADSGTRTKKEHMLEVPGMGRPAAVGEIRVDKYTGA
jgi:hypothetical protein